MSEKAATQIRQAIRQSIADDQIVKLRVDRTVDGLLQMLEQGIVDDCAEWEWLPDGGEAELRGTCANGSAWYLQIKCQEAT